MKFTNKRILASSVAFALAATLITIGTSSLAHSTTIPATPLCTDVQLQSAIDLAAQPGGDHEVDLTDTTCTLGATVTIPAGITLTSSLDSNGDPTGIITGTLVPTPPAQTPLLKIMGSGVTIDKLKIDGAGSSQASISLDSAVTDLNITNNQIIGGSANVGSVISLLPAIANLVFTGNKIEGHSSSGMGIYLQASYGNGVTKGVISGNEFIGDFGSCINTWGAVQVTIDNNRFSTSSSDISFIVIGPKSNISEAGEVTVTSNYFDSLGASAAAVSAQNPGYLLRFTGNYLSGSGFAATLSSDIIAADTYWTDQSAHPESLSADYQSSIPVAGNSFALDASTPNYLPYACQVQGPEIVCTLAAYFRNFFLSVDDWANGQNAYFKTTVNAGDTTTLPTPPTKPGYYFLGWYRADFCGDRVNNVIDLNMSGCATTFIGPDATQVGAINGNAPFVADWAPIPMVTLNTDAQYISGSTVGPDWIGGYAQADQTGQVLFPDPSIWDPTGTTKEGSVLSGWVCEFVDGTEVTVSPAGHLLSEDSQLTLPGGLVLTGPSANIAGTCTAQWTLQMLAVTFHDLDGNAISPVSQVSYGSPVTQPADLAVDSTHTFTGWSTVSGNCDESNLYDFSTDVTAPFDLYACQAEIQAPPACTVAGSPALTFTQASASPAQLTYGSGQVATFTYSIKNSGDRDLTDLWWSVNRLSAPSGISSPAVTCRTAAGAAFYVGSSSTSVSSAVLAVGQVITCTVTYSPVAADFPGSVTHSLGISASTVPNGNECVKPVTADPPITVPSVKLVAGSNNSGNVVGIDRGHVNGSDHSKVPTTPSTPTAPSESPTTPNQVATGGSVQSSTAGVAGLLVMAGLAAGALIWRRRTSLAG